jgi:hypothetical protein
MEGMGAFLRDSTWFDVWLNVAGLIFFLPAHRLPARNTLAKTSLHLLPRLNSNLNAWYK